MWMLRGTKVLTLQKNNLKSFSKRVWKPGHEQLILSHIYEFFVVKISLAIKSYCTHMKTEQGFFAICNYFSLACPSIARPQEWSRISAFHSGVKELRYTGVIVFFKLSRCLSLITVFCQCCSFYIYFKNEKWKTMTYSLQHY